MSYSKEQVVEMCKAVHGNRYDYSITQGVQNKLGKIQYICPIHGIQEQVLNNHLQGKGCKQCANLARQEKQTPTKEEFLEKAAKKGVNINEYDWTKFDLLKRDEKKRVEFVCKKHGPYWDWPSNFLKGHGCHVCYGRSKDDEEVRQELSKLHPTLDFSQTRYSEHDELYRIKVICPKHGEQLISYYNLINGQGCYWCGREKAALSKTISSEEFIRRGEILFGDAYSYDNVDMYNRDDYGRVIVTCKKHGDFKTIPSNFLKGCGCPKCHESFLENIVRIELEKNGIEYIYECGKSFLPWLGGLRLDFYLPKYNIAIECQGMQHFRPIEVFGGKEVFKKQVENDKRKALLCKQNNIKLLYFSNIQQNGMIKDKRGLIEEILKTTESSTLRGNITFS